MTGLIREGGAAVRRLLRAPGFNLIATLTLALGLAANIAAAATVTPGHRAGG